MDSKLCIQVESIEREDLDSYKVDCFKINILYDLQQIFFIEVFENPKLYQLDTGIWSGGPQDQILTDIIGEIQCVKYNYNQNTQEICEDICQNIVTTVQKLDSLGEKLNRFHQ